jgi:hypothetical protein
MSRTRTECILVLKMLYELNQLHTHKKPLHSSVALVLHEKDEVVGGFSTSRLRSMQTMVH